MRYLIDGYNLLHAMGILCGKVGPHGLERARLALLGRLGGDHSADAGSVTVVFDASGAPPGAVAEGHYGGIQIRYALESEADEVIEALIQQEATPSQLTVVSDDRRIQQAARRHRCVVRNCLDYLEETERQRLYKPVAAEMPAKPENVSREEVQQWLKEFADLTKDTTWREALGPTFGDEKEQ